MTGADIFVQRGGRGLLVLYRCHNLVCTHLFMLMKLNVATIDLSGCKRGVLHGYYCSKGWDLLYFYVFGLDETFPLVSIVSFSCIAI